jgi:hypothetical protein
MSRPRLNHLVLVPRSGLANRMRAIAAARRLCQLAGAHCTIVWDWGDYAALFEPDPDIEVISRIPPELASKYLAIRSNGRETDQRCVPLDGPAGIILAAAHCCGATTDAKSLNEFDLLPWMPQPSQAVRERVRLFRAKTFDSGGIVGMHMRRTDNEAARVLSCDWLFDRMARAIIAKGDLIYLAADNQTTETMMLARFPGHILHFPKNPAQARRWPRAFDLEETIADYADLLLLASCDHVLGSSDSSYSMLAMALNGSPDCRTLRRLDLGDASVMDRLRAPFHEMRVLLFRLRQLARHRSAAEFATAILQALRKRCA